MEIEILYKIKNNRDYKNYLHTHSYWYKYLNRNPKFFNDFIKEYKEFNRKVKSNKIKNTIDTIDTLLSVITTLNS